MSIVARLLSETTNDVIDEGCLHRVATDDVLRFAEQHRDASEFFIDVHEDTIDLQLAQHACSLMHRIQLSGGTPDTAWRFKTAVTFGRWRRMPAEGRYEDVCPRNILIASTRRIPVTPGAWIDISSNHHLGVRVFYAAVTACDADADRRAWATLDAVQSEPCPSPMHALLAHFTPDASAMTHGVVGHDDIVTQLTSLLVTDAHPHVERYENICGFMEFSRRRLEQGMLDDDDDDSDE